MFSCSLTNSLFFFFNDTATTEIYTLSLHDALPIFEVAGEADGGESALQLVQETKPDVVVLDVNLPKMSGLELAGRSEEHTSELQSQSNLVCRLLLEKKNKENYLHLLSTHAHYCPHA